jgi:hypothetical protein
MSGIPDADQSTNRPRPDTDQTANRLQSDSAALISAKDETISTLRDQLEAERQAHAEARRIIAGLVERIPAIEAPSEARESPQPVEEESGRAEPRPSSEGRQEPPEAFGSRGSGTARGSLWRRIFGR